MPTAANRYVISGSGIEATIDTAGFTGEANVSLTVDDTEVANPVLQITDFGIQAMGQFGAVEDRDTVHIRVVVPEVNITDGDVEVDGVALLATARTSIGGPGLVEGAIQSYEVRTVSGTASAVEF